MAFVDITLLQRRDIIGNLDSGVRGHDRNREKRLRSGVTYEVIFHDRSSRIHTRMCIPGHTVCPRRHGAPLLLSLFFSFSLPIEPCVRSDIQIAAKPALNGTRSSDVDVLKSCVEIKICLKIR